ncbi:MAG: hypothetical protein JWM27_4891 [Gemmatimonadetes bacterium]|nr:hypothetical protein [Gemmatimonadota bacterium]
MVPWDTVNETAPSRLAEHLPLTRSPRGGRKYLCPFCGGRNFSPLKRAWYCYSGCGGHAYSNVDTAARLWELQPADACRQLADLLGIAVGEEPPWREVAAHGSDETAAVLGLTAGAGRYEWNCPVCAGAGTLRSYRRRWRCRGSPCAGDAQQGWKGHVDVAMGVWGTTPADACFRLAAALRGSPPRTAPPRPEPPEEPGPRERALAVIRTRPGCREPAALYELLLAHLRMGSLGRAELARRRIDAAAAEAYGFRSTEPGEWQRRVLPLMSAFSDEELLAAGFPRVAPPRADARARGSPWWPGRGRAPLLVIPVWDDLRLAGVRFRNLADPEASRCPRYVSPKDANPDAPFNAAALARASPALHVVEGELNAYVLLSEPYRAVAVGLPGAWTWQDAWGLRIPDATRQVVGWFDADAAGRKGAARIRDSLARTRGVEWARRRWRTVLLDRDACDLHREWRLGALLRRAPWVHQDVGPLWSDAEADIQPPDGRPP